VNRILHVASGKHVISLFVTSPIEYPGTQTSVAMEPMLLSPPSKNPSCTAGGGPQLPLIGPR